MLKVDTVITVHVKPMSNTLFARSKNYLDRDQPDWDLNHDPEDLLFIEKYISISL